MRNFFAILAVLYLAGVGLPGASAIREWTSSGPLTQIVVSLGIGLCAFVVIGRIVGRQTDD